MNPKNRQEWIDNYANDLKPLFNSLFALEKENKDTSSSYKRLFNGFQKKLKLYEEACDKHELLKMQEKKKGK